jgi:hypothetical protein
MVVPGGGGGGGGDRVGNRREYNLRAEVRGARYWETLLWLIVGSHTECRRRFPIELTDRLIIIMTSPLLRHGTPLLVRLAN